MLGYPRLEAQGTRTKVSPRWAVISPSGRTTLPDLSIRRQMTLHGDHGQLMAQACHLSVCEMGPLWLGNIFRS